MSKTKNNYRINEDIRQKTVRITGEGITSRVCDIKEALSIAEEMGVDLVEVNSTTIPSICKLIRYDKFLYEEKRKAKEIDKKNRDQRIEVKEIRLTPNIDTHDLDFKSKHAIKFLSEGNKVKTVIFFGGREIMFKERGEKVLLDFVQKLEEFGVPESLPSMEGKKMFLTVKPKKNGKN